MKHTLGLTCITALAMAACSAGAEDPTGETVAATSAALSAAETPVYNGGALETSPAIVLLFWGPNVNSIVKNAMPGFYQTITSNAYLDVADEYGTTTQVLGRGTFSAQVTITPAHTSTALTDADVQAELFSQVQAGKVPAISGGIYQIYFPPGVTIDRSCHDFCAYHRSTTIPFSIGGLTVAYSVIPDMGPGSGCSCGSGTQLENTSALSSHELMESITDPFPNTGWSPEVADPRICQDDVATPRGTIFAANGTSYRVQPIWSLAAGACVSVPPATVGVFRPGSGSVQDEWLLRSTNTAGSPNFDFIYGGPGDQPVVGDWNGSNERTIGIYRPSTFQWYLRNSNTAGNPDITAFAYGGQGDIPIVGDWDGNGTTTVGVFRPAGGPLNQTTADQWLLKNSNSQGSPDIQFSYGQAGDIPVVGDWTGIGKTTIGVYRPSSNQWFLRNSNSAGNPDIPVFAYGGTGDMPVVGSWSGNGKTTVGVYRPAPNSSSPAQWLLRNSNTAGSPDLTVNYGGLGDLPVVGPWRRHL